MKCLSHYLISTKTQKAHISLRKTGEAVECSEEALNASIISQSWTVCNKNMYSKIGTAMAIHICLLYHLGISTINGYNVFSAFFFLVCRYPKQHTI